MKKSIIIVIFGLLMSMALFSCSKEDGSVPVDGELTPVEFQMGISTRAHDAQWDANDDVGLTMLAQGTQRILDNVFNYDYYTPTTAGLFQARTQGKVIYFPQDGSRVTFKGYYPYHAAMSRDMLLPVNVSSQTALPQIDLMTAEHLAGFSKLDRVVHLNFHHRLSKMIFKLLNAPGEEAISLEDLTVTINGMETQASYDLMNENLIVTQNTQAPITFPYRNDPTDRYGIVLPRPAGSGVTFSFRSSTGDEYTAVMSDTLNLKAGYKYTFYVTLKETAAIITADIAPWIDGPESQYDALQITGDPGSNDGAIDGDIMKVYLEGTNGFDLLENYTYVESSSAWVPDQEVYWEQIPTNPAVLRASLEREPALNNTQMPDVLVSETISVERNKSAHFELERAATKVFVKLSSSTFTAQQLAGATIELPQYLTGGTVVNGEYVAGPPQQRANILVDRTNMNLGVALFNPQIVSPGSAVINVTIDGRTYTAYAGTDGMSYEAGVANTLVVNLDEQAVTVSASIVDWKNGTPSYLTVGDTGTPAGGSENVSFGTQMTVFMTAGNDAKVGDYTFTYTTDGIWRTNPQIEWSDINESTYPGPYTARSWIVVNSAALNGTQIPDYLVSDEVTFNRYDGANFTLAHAGSKVVITLSSSTYTAEQLAAATVTLPGYRQGATYSEGQLVNNSPTTGDIVPVDQDGARVAIIEPQTIAQGGVIAHLEVAGVQYDAKALTEPFVYNPGEQKRITIFLDQDALTVSATVKDWDDAEYTLTALVPDATVGDNEGINVGERMEIYYQDKSNQPQTAQYTYGTNGWTANTPLYFDDVLANSPVRATLFRQETPYNPTQVADHMTLVDPIQLESGSSSIHFDFVHPAAKVFIQVTSDTYSQEELDAMTYTLPGYTRGGAVTRGIYQQGTISGSIIEVQKVGTEAIAIIDPQTISAGNTVVRITNQAGREYNVTYANPVIFQAGFATVLNITLNRTNIGLSATAKDWTPQTAIELTPEAINVGGQLEGTDTFFNDKTIYLYKWNPGYWADTYTYLPGANGRVWSGTPRYWDDQQFPFNITAFYFPTEGATPSINAGTTSFDWTVPANQSTGYEHYDILDDNLEVSSPEYLNFEFEHALSKVTVVLVSDEFNTSQLEGSTITLNNFVVDGQISLPQGTATYTGSGTTVTPFTEKNGSIYSALLMPGQTIPANTNMITITLPQYPNTPFQGALSTALTLEGGKNHILTIRLRRTLIEMSATVKPWDDENTGEIVIQ